jgi:clan AA aspartic protease
MIFGTFREGHPRATLSLPSPNGELSIEFIVDTGFEGDLALPAHLAAQLGPEPDGLRKRKLADGWVIKCPFYEVSLAWDDDERLTEVLTLQGHPLLGTVLLQDYLLQAEMVEGGDVVIEPL